MGAAGAGVARGVAGRGRTALGEVLRVRLDAVEEAGGDLDGQPVVRVGVVFLAVRVHRLPPERLKVLGEDARAGAVVGPDVGELVAVAVSGVVVDDGDRVDGLRAGEPSRLVVVDEDDGVPVEFLRAVDAVEVDVEDRLERAILLVADLARVLEGRLRFDRVRPFADRERTRHRVRIGVRVHQHGEPVVAGQRLPEAFGRGFPEIADQHPQPHQQDEGPEDGRGDQFGRVAGDGRGRVDHLPEVPHSPERHTQ